MDEQHYIVKKVDFNEVLRELNEAWEELNDPNSTISQDAKTQGINIESLRGLKREDAILIKRDESGMAMEAIVMAFVAHGVVELTKAAWVRLILPRIKRNLGDDSLKSTSDES